MATVNTNDLRVQNARNFVRTLTEEETNTFIFVGGVTPWENEEQPPTPVNNFKEIYKSHHEMLALSAIRETDVYHLIPKVRWTSGIIYDYYRHDYSPELTSYQGANNLYNSIFYVINQNNDVYVCLFNNYNRTSTVEPQNDTNEPFFTSDGYQWLRMYNISDQYMKNRATQNFMPIIFQDSNTRLEEGAVYTVVIDSPGDGFTRSAEGKSNQIREYYCNIVGDGEGAVARIRIDNSKVARVDVVRPGHGYTYATVDFVANRTYASLFDLDNQIDGLDPKGNGAFMSTVIISPPGGWGSDLVRQFGSVRVGVFSELEFNFDELLPNTQFRQIGILHNPEISQTNPSSLIGCYGVKVSVVDDDNEFKYGEEIRQFINTTDEIGNIIKTNIARGTVVGWDPDLQLLRYVQIPENHTDEDGKVYRFQNNQEIKGQETGKVALPDTTFNGSFKGSLFSEGYAVPELTPFTGETLYLTNISPVVRQETQTEKISLVVTY